MLYVLDTNILIELLRGSPFWESLVEKYQLTIQNIVICIVSVGEILSLSQRNGWGTRRTERLMMLLGELTIANIQNEVILSNYADIDTFSQGKHPHLPLQSTARNMGKNDLWISAVTTALGATLITTDKDFTHLHQVFFDLSLEKK